MKRYPTVDFVIYCSFYTKKIPSNSAATTSSDTLTPVEVSAETSTSTSTVVTVNIQYPSQTRGRNLPNDLQSLGKMLVRGTYKQIANAAWNNLNLRKQLQILAVKHVDNECHSLCSKKNHVVCALQIKINCSTFRFKSLKKNSSKELPLPMQFCVHLV